MASPEPVERHEEILRQIETAEARSNNAYLRNTHNVVERYLRMTYRYPLPDHDSAPTRIGQIYIDLGLLRCPAPCNRPVCISTLNRQLSALGLTPKKNEGLYERPFCMDCGRPVDSISTLESRYIDDVRNNQSHA